MMRVLISLSAVVLLLTSAMHGDEKAVKTMAKLEYNRDVRPILAENCFACHGPDSAARKGGLRLDQRENALKKKAIVPGKTAESELVARLHSGDSEEVMPPPSSHKKLTDIQKKTLERWIAEGAEYQSHWSLIAPKRPALPPVKNTAWVKNPIDAFVLAELERQKLKPAAEADRRTLARRVSFDLTGLPPSPDDVAAFVNDTAPNAYEKYVDKLLTSVHWGEHRGRYWLDYSRYADTHGIHFDNYREMWSYRDWVIKAFNKNMPFDQFTTEQIAGDLLPNATLDQRIATGFSRNNITTNEGGAIDEEYLVLYARDRTETFGQVYFGMTTGCAVCHDHKFDPFSMKDFYSLSAFFNNTTQRAMDGNIKDTPPVMVVPLDSDRERWQAISKDVKDVQARIEERKVKVKPEFDKWLTETRASDQYRKIPTEKLHFQALLAEGAGSSTTALVNGQLRLLTSTKALTWEAGQLADKALKSKSDMQLSVEDAGDFDTSDSFSFGGWVNPDRIRGFAAILSRMDEGNSYRGWDLWIDEGKVGTHIVSKWMDDALKVMSNNAIPAKQWSHVFVTYDGSAKEQGVKIYINGVLQESRQIQVNNLKGSIKTKVPLRIGRRSNGATLNNHGLQDLRVYQRALSAAEVEALRQSSRTAWVLSKPADKRTDAEKNDIFTWWLPTLDAGFRELISRQQKLQQEEAAIKGRGTVAHVMQEKPSEAMAYMLKRGEYDKRLDKVTPDTPKMLPTMPSDLPRNRVGLAKWLLQPDQPLTARVTVNRFWQEVFGNGLVRSSGDFGISGEQPSHPELLDWLAVEFRESGWDVKKFFKMLVMSNTYRQAAVVTPEKLEKDPANKWLSRGPRFRMDAEMVRDNALAVSGLLVRKIGGPSVKPYQPEGVWEAVAMDVSNTRIYKKDSGDNLYRRGIYTFWKRAAPPASLDIFNAPNRETCAVKRERTNTPLQALVTLNDIQYVEAARHLATLTLKAKSTTDERLNALGERLLSRPWKAEERAIIEKSLSELKVFYEKNEADAKKLITVGDSKPDDKLDAKELAAWTMLCNQLLNLDEVLNK
jgi:mono/diheme cytochrome c family protein